MARLIIGHTTHNATRIWVRGHERYPVAFVRLIGPSTNRTKRFTLEARHGYTGVVDFRQLKPRTAYSCSVMFGETLHDHPVEMVEFGHCSGKFTTFPRTQSNAPVTFLLGSCNLHTLGIIQSPDNAYKRLSRIAEDEHVNFMIHCGDQIYYDIPNPFKKPDIEEYRAKYLDAWGDSRPTRKFLTLLPHYMILDDHEMTDNFSNDMESSRVNVPPKVIRKISLKVYREFQHIHNIHSSRHFGNQALYYNFNFGKYQFFVLDTRTERYNLNTNHSTQMISDDQMSKFKQWLRKYHSSVKFVVTPVPFATEVARSDDKWNATHFSTQREEIMAFLLKRKISGVIFLTGDMHCSYHAKMEISDGNHTVTVHELMSSPINQLGKTSFSAFEPGRNHTAAQGFTYVTKLNRRDFYGEHSNSMLIKANNRTISYEIFRTKINRRKEVTGRFIV